MPKISELPAITTANNNDTIAIVETSTATTKKITRGDLLKAPLPANSVTTAAIANSNVTTAKIANASVTADKIDFTTLNFGNYSTTEQDTGFKWIDGKTIYKKTFTGTLTAAANVRLISTIPSFPSVETMVKAEGWFNGGSEIVMFGSTHVSGSGTINRTMAIRGDNQLITWSDTARTNAPYAFTIYYTKG